MGVLFMLDSPFQDTTHRGAPEVETAKRVGDASFGLERSARRWRPFLSVIRKQGVHVIAHAIAKIVADAAHAIQPDDHRLAVARRQLEGGFKRLFEHPDQCLEEALILQADVTGEAGSSLAVVDHQLSESCRFTNGLSITGDGLFRLSYGNILVP